MNFFTILSFMGLLSNFLQKSRSQQPRSQPQTGQQSSSNTVSSSDLNNFITQIANYKGRIR